MSSIIMPKEWSYVAIIVLGTHMARSRNLLPTVTITLSTNPQIKSYLSELVPSGLYGNNEADAAERLLARAIDQLIRDGSLKGKKSYKSSG
jgi:hypothetical protein